MGGLGRPGARGAGGGRRWVPDPPGHYATCQTWHWEMSHLLRPAAAAAAAGLRLRLRRGVRAGARLWARGPARRSWVATGPKPKPQARGGW
jgi:hypothetical protein